VLLASLPFYPLVSFLLLILFAKRLSWRLGSAISVGAMALTALVSGLLVFELSNSSSHFISVIMALVSLSSQQGWLKSMSVSTLMAFLP